ncbi:MAG TPA: ABC transporter substrate-binding protein [Candidatus Binatia bacterium]|nr:ABC transporter substrate-binding protein [Candidatus Binatia bacterium]
MDKRLLVFLNSCSENLKSKIQNLKWGGILAIAITFAIGGAVVHAQQPVKPRRVGLLLQGTSTSLETRLEGFQQGLRERGYVDGKNIVLEQRYDDDREERLAALAAELVSLRVEVIVAAATPAVIAAKQATATIPIVIVHSANPVALGLVNSFARPGVNVTGLSSASPDYSGKQLELLKEAIPKLSRIAILWNAANPGTAIAFREMQDAVRVLKLPVHSLEVRRSEDLAPVFKNIPRQRGMGLVTLLDPLVVSQRARIVELASESRLPAIYPTKDFVEAGGLMAYGADLTDSYRRAAIFMDKILKGAKPAELPLEYPTKFTFTVNLKTAAQIGVTIPPTVLARADKVIK